MASLLRRRRRRDDREDAAEGSRTDLIGAAAGGHTDTVTALLAAPGLAVTAADGAGWTALMLAVAGWRPHRSHTGAATALRLASDEIENANAARCHTAPRRRTPGILPCRVRLDNRNARCFVYITLPNSGHQHHAGNGGEVASR